MVINMLATHSQAPIISASLQDTASSAQAAGAVFWNMWDLRFCHLTIAEVVLPVSLQKPC